MICFMDLLICALISNIFVKDILCRPQLNTDPIQSTTDHSLKEKDLSIHLEITTGIPHLKALDLVITMLTLTPAENREKHLD